MIVVVPEREPIYVRRSITLVLEGDIDVVRERATEVMTALPFLTTDPASRARFRFRISVREDFLDGNGEIVPAAAIVAAANKGETREEQPHEAPQLRVRAWREWLALSDGLARRPHRHSNEHRDLSTLRIRSYSSGSVPTLLGRLSARSREGERGAAMSAYNGPSRPVHVRFTRDWFEVPAGTETIATFYPELGRYYVPLMNGQFIGTHPSHHGLLEEIEAKDGGPRE